MKRLSCFLATVALVLSTAVATAQNAYQQPAAAYQQPAQGYAQAAPVRSAGGSVAVLDMSRVFKEHARLKDLQESMKTEVQNIDNALKGENDTIRKLSEQLRDYSIGSPDYTNLDSQITNRKAKLQANVQLERKKLMLREAEMLHSVYTEVAQEVETIANSRGLLMVIQYADIPSSPNEPESVMSNLNKQVVWHNKSIDITEEVIARVNRGGAPAQYNNGTAQRPVSAAPRR